MGATPEITLKLKRIMIPSVILVILFVIVGIRFSQLTEKTREGTTIGRLHELRQAILLYYQDHNGVFPRELSPGSPFSRYLEIIPPVDKLHPRGGALSPVGNDVTYGNNVPEGYGRGWYYNYESGQIFVNSIGLDSRGNSYTTY
ncbi:hypothetical protein KAR34_07520 [bacterium]|nr:hypothetical protein [bacterium]